MAAHPECPYRRSAHHWALRQREQLPTCSRVSGLEQRRHAATKANAVRPGMIVDLDGKLLVVSKAVHTPGIGRQAGIGVLSIMSHAVNGQI